MIYLKVRNEENKKMRTWQDITISACIRYCRKQRGLTLKEVAKISGCSLQYIAQIERGEKSAPIEKCNAIFQSMGIEFDYSMIDELERNNDIIDFIECLYNQKNISADYLNIDIDNSPIYTYAFLYRILKNAGIELLIKNQNDEILFIQSCIGEILYNNPGLVGSFYCFLMSIVEQKKNNIADAENYILRALDLKKEKSLITPLLYMQYASVLDNKKLYLDSIHESKLALEYSVNHYDVALSALINMNIGITTSKIHMYEEAIQYFNHSLDIAKKIKNSIIIDKVNLNKMRTLFMYGQKEKAIALANLYSKYNNIDSCFILFIHNYFNQNEDYKKYQSIIENNGYKEVKEVVKYILSNEFGDELKDLDMLNKVSNDFFVHQILFKIILNNYNKHNRNNIGKLVSDIGINHIILS